MIRPHNVRMCIAGLLLASCSPSEPGEEREPRASIVTDRDAYALTLNGDSYTTRIVVTVANESDAPVYMSRCDALSEPYFQFFKAGTTEVPRAIGVGVICPGGPASAFVLQRSTTLVDTARVFADTAWARRDLSAFTGSFVIRFELYGSFENGVLGSPLDRESNVFTIDLPKK